MPELVKVVCPGCGLNRSDSAFKREDDSAYGTWNESRHIIQIRGIPGGKKSDLLVGTGKYRKSPGKGFPIIDSFTVDVAKDMPEYQEYLKQIAQQFIKVVRIFHDEGLISDAEIESMKG